MVQRGALRAVAQAVRQGLGAGGIAACHQQFDAVVGGWVARQRDITPPGQPLPSSPIARGTSLDVNALLGAFRPLPPLARK